MNLNENIFREYDIRGVVLEDFQNDVVESLGKAFGTYIAKKGWKSISVSGDIRETSLELKETFINGLLTTGAKVIDIGIVPTPTNYFSMYFLDTDAAVQITGSHNPPEFNGFKFSCKNESFYGSKIQELKKLILKKQYIKSKGTVKIKNVTNDYIEMLKSKIQLFILYTISITF